MPKKVKMESNMDELFQNIGKLAEKMKTLSQQAVKQYSIEVESIIRERDHDAKRIEWCLTYMLDFCFDEEMLTIYKKLCRYYYNINPEATVYYINEYREMWDEQELDKENR